MIQFLIGYNGNGFINLIFEIKVKELVILIFLSFMSVKLFNLILILRVAINSTFTKSCIINSYPIMQYLNYHSLCPMSLLFFSLKHLFYW